MFAAASTVFTWVCFADRKFVGGFLSGLSLAEADTARYVMLVSCLEIELKKIVFEQTAQLLQWILVTT